MARKRERSISSPEKQSTNPSEQSKTLSKQNKPAVEQRDQSTELKKRVELISDEQILAAADALKQLSSSKLWADDSPVQVVFSLGRLSDLRVSHIPKPIELPCALLEKADICLVVSSKTNKELLQQLKSNKGSIAKVITLSKLRKNYEDHEEKKKLVHRFDMFLLDKNSRRSFFGAPFFNQNKIPVPVSVKSVEQVLCRIEKLKSSTFFCPKGSRK